MTTGLQDCPFCGSDYLRIVEIPPSPSHLNTLTTFHVECGMCFVCGPQANEPQTRGGAIEAWDELRKQMNYRFCTYCGDHLGDTHGKLDGRVVCARCVGRALLMPGAADSVSITTLIDLDEEQRTGETK